MLFVNLDPRTYVQSLKILIFPHLEAWRRIDHQDVPCGHPLHRSFPMGLRGRSIHVSHSTPRRVAPQVTILSYSIELEQTQDLLWCLQRGQIQYFDIRRDVTTDGYHLSAHARRLWRECSFVCFRVLRLLPAVDERKGSSKNLWENI